MGAAIAEDRTRAQKANSRDHCLDYANRIRADNLRVWVRTKTHQQRITKSHQQRRGARHQHVSSESCRLIGQLTFQPNNTS